MNDLTPLEREVMLKLLSPDEGILSILYEQFQVASVAKREMTGVGFYTTFAILHDAPQLPGSRSFKFGDVAAKKNPA